MCIRYNLPRGCEYAVYFARAVELAKLLEHTIYFAHEVIVGRSSTLISGACSIQGESAVLDAWIAVIQREQSYSAVLLREQ